MGLMGGSAPFYSIGQQIPKIDADQVIQTTGLLGSSKGEQWRSSPVSRRASNHWLKRATCAANGPLRPTRTKAEPQLRPEDPAGSIRFMFGVLEI